MLAWYWDPPQRTYLMLIQRQGWPDGTYHPTLTADRDAMAAFFYRYQGSPAVTAPSSSEQKSVP